jgi:hypothetical protein
MGFILKFKSYNSRIVGSGKPLDIVSSTWTLLETLWIARTVIRGNLGSLYFVLLHCDAIVLQFF